MHPSDTVVKAAGMALGIIAALEVPENEWPDFLTLMTENSTHDD